MSAFSKLLTRPLFVIRFALYLTFLVLAYYIYVSDIMSAPEDKATKNLFCIMLFLYGCFRLIRTWQQYQEALREDKQNNENE